MDDAFLERETFLASRAHILVLGGPGSGKTTEALHKAHHEIESGDLQGGQRILFLSFARATIARVAERATTVIAGAARKHLEINTYHGFAWNLIRSHGYLLNADTRIALLPPPEAASRLAEVEASQREEEKRRLFDNEGLLHFDLFAPVAAELLTRSDALATIVSDAYPLTILDEFQDTNAEEWRMIQALGKGSQLVALADAEQRIYEFRGADPRRIGEFIAAYDPVQFDLGSVNHRSTGTDIVMFGNDLLTGKNKAKKYTNVKIVSYPFRRGNGTHLDLKTTVLAACKRLRDAGMADWSVAVLVPTKRLMIDVSDYLSKEQLFPRGRLPVIQHEVALDTEAPALAATLIAGLLEKGEDARHTGHRFILDLCTHIRGRKGNKPPTQIQLRLTEALASYVETEAIRGRNRERIVDEAGRIARRVHDVDLSGDPWEDWLAMRRMLADSHAPEIQQVAADAMYLRLLHRGATLRARLSELWRANGSYSGAASAVRDALLQEHFSASTRVWRGVHVMTIHKSKGKEFDEVVIYEGRYQGRIIHSDATEKEVSQARLALRVAVTRAMRLTTILTPVGDPCAFL